MPPVLPGSTARQPNRTVRDRSTESLVPAWSESGSRAMASPVIKRTDTVRHRRSPAVAFHQRWRPAIVPCSTLVRIGSRRATIGTWREPTHTAGRTLACRPPDISTDDQRWHRCPALYKSGSHRNGQVPATTSLYGAGTVACRRLPTPTIAARGHADAPPWTAPSSGIPVIDSRSQRTGQTGPGRPTPVATLRRSRDGWRGCRRLPRSIPVPSASCLQALRSGRRGRVRPIPIRTPS